MFFQNFAVSKKISVLLCCSSWGDRENAGYGQGQNYPGDAQMGYGGDAHYSPYNSQAKYQTGGPEYI